MSGHPKIKRINKAKEKANLNISIPKKKDDFKMSALKDDSPHSIPYRELKVKRGENNKLGFGASGKVVRVYHKGIPYALKIVHHGFEVPLEVIIREKKSLHSSVNCNSIIKLYEVYKVGGSIKLLLEYMDAGSLEEVLKYSCMPENIISLISRQILVGLSYCQTKKIVHRDIKPANILFNRSGNVKICDFGLSNQIASANTTPNAVDSEDNPFPSKGVKDVGSGFQSFKGSYVYMSPERLKGEKHYFNSDIWSLGLTVLEAFFGIFPFDEDKKDVFTYLDFLEKDMKKHSIFSTKNAMSSKIEKSENEEIEGEGEEQQKLNVNLPKKKSKKKYISKEFRSFCLDCCSFDYKVRPNAKDLLDHEFIKIYNDDLSEKDCHNIIGNWLKENYLSNIPHTPNTPVSRKKIQNSKKKKMKLEIGSKSTTTIVSKKKKVINKLDDFVIPVRIRIKSSFENGSIENRDTDKS